MTIRKKLVLAVILAVAAYAVITAYTIGGVSMAVVAGLLWTAVILCLVLLETD